MRFLTAILTTLMSITVSLGVAQAAYAPTHASVAPIALQPLWQPPVALQRVWHPPVADRLDPIQVAHSHPTLSVNPEHRCPKFEAMFEQYGLLPVETFSYIAYRESRCRIKAINILYNQDGTIKWALNHDKSFDSGMFQINSSWVTVTRKVCGGGLENLLVLDCNLRVAKFLLDNGGLKHWSLG